MHRTLYACGDGDHTSTQPHAGPAWEFAETRRTVNTQVGTVLHADNVADMLTMSPVPS
jgi:hypothetical protein